MAKAIKFNLILNGSPVRNTDDLLDNFNIEDLLAAYRNGSLKRWLETRELTEQVAALEKIKGDDIETAMELCRIFHGSPTKQQLETAAYPFAFRQKEAEKLQQYKNIKEQKDEIIRTYHGGYEKLLKEIEAKNTEYPFVKSGVAEIFRSYTGLYRLDAWAFYQRFIKNRPLVILAMLANADMRPLIAWPPEEVYKNLDIEALIRPQYRKSDIDAFLERFNKDNDQPEVQKIKHQSDNRKLRQQKLPILMLDCSNHPELNGSIFNSDQLGENYFPNTYVPLESICAPLPNHIKIFAGETQGYWKDLQPKGSQFLIIKMDDGDFIRNAGTNNEEIKPDDVNGKFPILDGIDYKSNNASHQLIYMEV